MLIKHFSHIRKPIDTIDEKLVQFLFGDTQGYEWGNRGRLEQYFQETIAKAGGFIQFGTETRILYHKPTVFTVFKTEKYEFAFNRIISDEAKLFANSRPDAHVFLFHNNQRVISIRLSQVQQFIHRNEAQHKIEDHMIHWSINNQWISNYFDFMNRIDRSIHAIKKTN